MSSKNVIMEAEINETSHNKNLGKLAERSIKYE